MNMHHITKSLFVGAAIAGIGMSSSHAEVPFQEETKLAIREVIKEHMAACYNKVKDCISLGNLYDCQNFKEFFPDTGSYHKGEDIGWDKHKEEDIQLIYDSLFGKNGYLSHFDKDGRNPYSSYNGKKVIALTEFFKTCFPNYGRSGTFLGQSLKYDSLWLMRFLRTVAIECSSYGNYATYFSNFKTDGIVVRDNNSFGNTFSPEWSFVFEKDFCETIATKIENELFAHGFLDALFDTLEKGSLKKSDE